MYDHANWRWPNFTRQELACKHCGGFDIPAAFLDRL